MIHIEKLNLMVAACCFVFFLFGKAVFATNIENNVGISEEQNFYRIQDPIKLTPSERSQVYIAKNIDRVREYQRKRYKRIKENNKEEHQRASQIKKEYRIANKDHLTKMRKLNEIRKSVGLPTLRKAKGELNRKRLINKNFEVQKAKKEQKLEKKDDIVTSSKKEKNYFVKQKPLKSWNNKQMRSKVQKEKNINVNQVNVFRITFPPPDYF